MTIQQIKIKESILEIVQGDITKQDTDAIVNAANKRLTPGGGVSGAIHRAAGKKLWEECKTLGICQTGEAKLTKGYNLPASYVIHTVGPVYSGKPSDAEKLASCYQSSIRLARKHGIRSISFPAISTGIYGYPMEKAAEIALKTIIDELNTSSNSLLIRFVLYDKKAVLIHKNVLQNLLHQ